MPHQITVNNKVCDVFSQEECETDQYINGEIPMFTGKDIVEIVSMSRDESFSSTSEYYRQLSGYIRCINDENDRSEAWFLKEENIELIQIALVYLACNSEGERKQIKSLLKQIK